MIVNVLPRSVCVSALVVICGAGAATANPSVVAFDVYANWSAAVGGLDQKIDFVLGGVQDLDDQYSYLGVHFTPGNAASIPFEVQDGWGLNSAFDANATVPVTFDVPQHAFALDYISPTQLTFYLGDVLVYQSITFSSIPSDKFRGYVLSDAFDKVVMSKGSFGTGGDFTADNLYIGTPLPGPGALAVAVLAGALARTRRRR